MASVDLPVPHVSDELATKGTAIINPQVSLFIFSDGALLLFLYNDRKTLMG